MMRALVVGSGGREHALVWSLRRSRHVTEVICAPGNGGIEHEARCFKVAPQDHNGILDLVRSQKVDCVVVGPEAPLAEGLSDCLQAHGIPVVGPCRDAARLESSKGFAKEFMARYGVPTGSCVTFTSSARRPSNFLIPVKHTIRWWSRPTGWPPARGSSSQVMPGGTGGRAAHHGGARIWGGR